MSRLGLTLQEVTSDGNRAEGMRSFMITHETRDIRRMIMLTCHSQENVSHWSDGVAGADPQFIGDAETLVKNADLAHLLSAFTTQLLSLVNISHLGDAPIHLGC